MDLLSAEAHMFRDAPRVDPHSSSDEAINERYASGEVRIVTEQARYPLTAIKDMVDGDSYELNPEFQRRHRWDVVRKSRLIESFIMNVPIPPIFLYEARFSYFEVMDGLQRLSAIRDFYADSYALTGLTEWPDLNGRKYSELPEEVRRGVDRRYLSSIILLYETAKTDEEAQRLKQLVFERINSGGERLTHQESRNAVYPGPMNSLCLKLARDPNLCRLWNIPTATAAELASGDPADGDPVLSNKLYQTMADAELVLRFFAYRQQLDHQDGRALRDYLDEYLRLGNLLPQAVVDELGQIFRETAALVFDVFGPSALFLPKVHASRWVYANRPTLTVYDPLMWAVSRHLAQAPTLRSRSSLAKRRLHELYVANIDSFSGRTANPADIRVRNDLFDALLTDIVEQDEAVEASVVQDFETFQLDEPGDEVVAQQLSFSEDVPGSI